MLTSYLVDYRADLALAFLYVLAGLAVAALWPRVVGVRAARGYGPRIRLVGAGPGSAELLTRAAYRALQEADLILADRLVSPEVLACASPHAEVRIANKCKGSADPAQSELHRWVLQGLAEGKDVVRLKGGDPFMYGRGGEEVAAFCAQGYDVEVVPGISSALSAPLAGGIAVTTRGVADQLMVCTAHGKGGSVPDVPPFRHGRSTVFLMGVSRLEKLCAALAAEGWPDDLPVAVVERATTKAQRQVEGTLATIAAVVRAANVNSPASIVVGEAVGALRKASRGSRFDTAAGSVVFFGLKGSAC